MNQKALFISRPLATDSPFYSIFPLDGPVRIYAESLLEFCAIPFDHIPPTDWIFFYSPNGVRFFFEQVKQQHLTISNSVRWAVLGDGTSKALREFGKAPDFAGNGLPDQVAPAFGVLAAGMRVLFPQASESRQSIQKFLGSAVETISMPVYQNQIRIDFQLPVTQLLIFTSPLNVQAFYTKYPERTSIPALAIGQSTRQALEALEFRKIYTVEKPSELLLAQRAYISLQND